jgi:small subunit ribosomal protein S6
MSARAAQAGAEQGADEERKGDVQESTATAHRSQQRRNVSASTGSVGGSADEQAGTVRGSWNQYEVAILYHPDLEVDLSKAEDRVQKIFTDAGGKVEKTDNWGKRKLAYTIKKQEHAVYVFYTVEIPAEGVQKVEAALNITDEVIRFLITKPDLKAMAKAEELKKEKAKKAAERGQENPPAGGEEELSEEE